MNIIIRKAVESDLPQIFRVEKRSYIPQLRAKQSILRYRLETFGIWVAEYNNKIVGFFTCVPARLSFPNADIALVLKNRKPDYLPWFEEYRKSGKFYTLFVTSTAVEKAYQSKGVGTALVRYSLELAKQLGLNYRASALRCQYASFYNRTKKSIKDYIEKVKAGQIKDRFLGLYLKLGFKLSAPLPNYEPYKGSLNYNVLAYKKVR
jgi:GNAT superfamily N-acetyltransferase